MNITFTLTAATSGTTAAGPFNISGTTNANVVSSLATGVTKIQLTTGHTINGVNDAITGGTIASTGTCTTTTPWSVIQPTPTPTPTATATPSYEYQLGPSYTQANIGLACSNIGMDFFTPVYAVTDIPGNVVQFFNDPNLTSGYVGEAEYHTFYRTGGVVTYIGQVSPSGFVTDKTVCL